MNRTKKKYHNTVLTLLVSGIIIAAGIVFNFFNGPHRNVQETATDHQVTPTAISGESLLDAQKANNKYLDPSTNIAFFVEITVFSAYNQIKTNNLCN